DVAVQDDVAHVVAERHEDSSTAIVYCQVHPDREHIEVTELSEGSATARAPRVAVSGRDVWVVWQDEKGQEQPHRPAIYLRHSHNGGHPFGPAVRVTSGSGRSIQPAIALLDADHPVVVWADNTGGAFDVYAQAIGVDGPPLNLSAHGKQISS